MSFYIITPLHFFENNTINGEPPSTLGIIIYSVITPLLCCCGILGNLISLLVLSRKELIGSVYTYLAVLACVDLGTSLILVFGGISRGIMWNKKLMKNYDSLVGLPIGGVLAILGVLAVVALTLDRVIYLWRPIQSRIQCTKPKFCTPYVARRIMILSFLIAVLFNLPYCFIYDWGRNNTLITTPFFDTRFYKAFNWFSLIIFAVLPAIILLLGNGFLIFSLRKVRIINEKSKKCRTNFRKKRDHTNLTITLVIIIIFFLITNIPESLVSRTAAINILFKGDHNCAKSKALESIRQICMILAAIDVNTNFIFYYTFCPAFCKILRKFRLCKRKQPFRNLQVNVFVLNGTTKCDQLNNTNIGMKNLQKLFKKLPE